MTVRDNTGIQTTVITNNGAQKRENFLLAWPARNFLGLITRKRIGEGNVQIKSCWCGFVGGVADI